MPMLEIVLFPNYLEPVHHFHTNCSVTRMWGRGNHISCLPWPKFTPGGRAGQQTFLSDKKLASDSTPLPLEETNL